MIAPGGALPSRVGAEISRLIEVYGLPQHLARMVADRRLTLEAACHQHDRNRQRRKVEARAEPAARPVTRSRPLLAVAIVALLATGVVGGLAARRWQGTVEETRDAAALGRVRSEGRIATTSPAVASPVAFDPADATRLATDDSGVVREIRGPNPTAVLLAHCAATSMFAPREPLELAATVPAQPGVRLGLYRQFGESPGLFALRIHKDNRTRTWVAGGGEALLPVFPADHVNLGEPRVAVGIR